MVELNTKHTAFLLALVGVFAATWYAWTHQGQAHNTTADAAYADNGYEPYAWWIGHGHQGARTFLYPATTMMNCHPQALQNSEGTLSVASSVVGHG